VSFAAITIVLLLKECLLLLWMLFVSLGTQSGNLWIYYNSFLSRSLLHSVNYLVMQLVVR
jgi:hypothetical protein